MTILKDIIADYSPSNNSSGIPLSSTITITFDRLMDTDVLEREFFISGPDTDQFVGPGLAEFNIYPDNVSQGDDFLTSPGYQGIVAGAFSFETVAGATEMTFTPSAPMAPLTQYTAHLPEADDTNSTTYSGHVTFSWTSGSGSIEALPSTGSTSVLSSVDLDTELSSQTALEIVSTTPANNQVEVTTELSEIEIEFNKEIASSSVNASNIVAKVYAAIDHPALSASIPPNNDLATQFSVDGKKIVIAI